MAWTKITREYFTAATEFRDACLALLSTIQEVKAVAKVSAAYLDAVLFCVDAAVDTGKIRETHSKEASAVEASSAFKACRSLT